MIGIARGLLTVIAIGLVADSVFATRIDSFRVRESARMLVRHGHLLGVPVRGEAETPVLHRGKRGGAFYSVKLRERGTLFFSEDDSCLVAFTSSTNDFSVLEDGSPLKVLLDRDAEVRSRIASLSASASSPYYSDHTNHVSAVDDVRVPPLLATRWSQSAAGGRPCYNYYTPSNYLCGCSATAIAQVMRYFRFPAAAIPSFTNRCVVGGNFTNLVAQGGIYDWSLMTEVPGYTNYNDASWAAIGKLTSDVGIALGSGYYKGGTGADSKDFAPALQKVFGYANACGFEDPYVYNDADKHGGVVANPTGLHLRETRQKMIAANLDAGLPVVLAIYGYEAGHLGDSSHVVGHAIVGDGYGYCNVDGEEVPYFHLNLGWAGMDDAWYNLPEVNTVKTGAYITSSGEDYTVLDGCVFNIFTNQTGEIISGRVLDGDGQSVSDAQVSIDGLGSTRSNAYGIYALYVPDVSSYVVRATDLVSTGSVVATITCRSSDSTCGNSWGNDIVLGVQHDLRNTPTNFYVSIEDGIDALGRGTANAPFASIQYALDSQEYFVAGDVVNVLPGTYCECVTAPDVPIRIVAVEGPEKTVIDGGYESCCFDGSRCADVLLSGFTIVNGEGGGVYCGTVSNCVIRKCENYNDGYYCDGYGGGAVASRLYDCVISSNMGEFCGGAAGCVLVNCTLFDNLSLRQSGVSNGSAGGVDRYCALTNCIVWRNWSLDDYSNDYHISNYPTPTPYRTNSVFAYSCTSPVGFVNQGGCLTDDPRMVSIDADDWRLRSGSPCLGTGLGGVNMGAWQGEGLDGFVVSVAISGFGNVTPVACLLAAGESATFMATSDHPFLGFATNGVRVASSNVYTWPDVRADGVLSAFFGSTNFWLDAETGDDDNDGLSVQSGWRTLEEMSLRVGRGDRVLVRPGRYAGCAYAVPGVEVESTDGPNVTIIDGERSGICVYAEDMVYRGFSFINGAANRGGGAYGGTIVDSVISNCYAANTGGGACWASLVNCLVVDCTARSRPASGGTYECILTNCTLFANGAMNTIDFANVLVSFDTNLFVDVAAGDYRLAAGSPAIDAGTNFAGLPEHDLDGTNRIYGVQVDLGCYEYHPLPNADFVRPQIAPDETPSSVSNKIREAMRASGFDENTSAAVGTLTDYDVICDWATLSGVDHDAHVRADAPLLAPALGASTLLDAEDVPLTSFAPTSAAGGFRMLLTPSDYAAAKVHLSLLRSAIGIVGGRTLNGGFSADELTFTVTPLPDAIQVDVSAPADEAAYFLRPLFR